MIFCTQGWQHKPVILVFEKLRQEDKKYKASLGYMMKSRPIFATKKPCLKITKQGRQDGSRQGFSQRCEKVNVPVSCDGFQTHHFWSAPSPCPQPCTSPWNILCLSSLSETSQPTSPAAGLEFNDKMLWSKKKMLWSQGVEWMRLWKLPLPAVLP